MARIPEIGSEYSQMVSNQSIASQAKLSPNGQTPHGRPTARPEETLEMDNKEAEDDILELVELMKGYSEYYRERLTDDNKVFFFDWL